MARDYALRRDTTVTEPWTDARVEDVRRLWFAGKSAAEIAKALGGTTRGAVLGVVHRNGWKRTGDPNPAGSASHRTIVSPKPRIAPRAPTPAEPRAEGRVEGIGIMALTLTTCRFVVDATRHDQRFCGAWCADVEPYCASHRRVCWTGTPPAVKPPRRERL